LKKVNYILDLLRQGKNLALVSDAGTPGISDPGNKLISQILEYNQAGIVKILPVPGPSALAAAASISGFLMDRFVFMGFPPAKKKRKKFFEEITNSKYPVIFYESPHRILKTLKELKIILSSKSPKNEPLELRVPEIVVCRELTKKFETIYRGKIDKVIEELEKKENRGEFTVIVRR
jgi:16S rRNA (cytidine1402-2'-O)-methyltransferase